jgi:hypothetical protein
VSIQVFWVVMLIGRFIVSWPFKDSTVFIFGNQGILVEYILLRLPDDWISRWYIIRKVWNQ